MGDSSLNGREIERLVDRHIELCELFERKRAPGSRAAPILVTRSEGKSVAESLVDLVDRALVAYEGSGFSQDYAIYSLKVALVQVIDGKLD
jgi:hypothetical protein